MCHKSLYWCRKEEGRCSVEMWVYHKYVGESIVLFQRHRNMFYDKSVGDVQIILVLVHMFVVLMWLWRVVGCCVIVVFWGCGVFVV